MISLEFNNNSSKGLYVQLYEYLRDELSSGRIAAEEKLPSLRSLAAMLGISVTTVKAAYDQLLVEGYLVSKPNSGYFAARGAEKNTATIDQARSGDGISVKDTETADEHTELSCDPESFDFVKWKKCITAVLSETPELLLHEADKQGEPALRKELSEYLYRSRGVVCGPDQVVISAGTQQLVNHLARILRMMDIEHVCTEDPGYLPVRNTFRDWGFSISNIPVKQDGIEIEKLPVNIRTAVYVCPQNQFPTGAVMPIGRRRQILEWAEANDSIVIEDDYNSELRYFGMPVPALQGLDNGSRVVYLGSFSSTLFPAVRISYMVLPDSMKEIYDSIKMNYDQTCSKTEQLTLARFMHMGYFQTNLRKVKKLYSRKLQKAVEALQECSGDRFIYAENTQSGINLILRIDTHAMTISEGLGGASRTEEIRDEIVERLVKAADSIGIKVKGIDQIGSYGRIYLIFYYNQIPIEKIKGAVREMTALFKAAVMKGSLSMPSVYEVIRLKEGKPVFLKEHYERLEKSLASLGMLPPFTLAELSDCIDKMAEENGIRNHNLKMEVDISGHSVIYMSPTHYPSEDMYDKGVKTSFFRGERKNPNIKMMDQELRDATDAAIKADDVYEVLLVDRKGNITEGSRSNVFFIRGNEVYTSPAEQVLLGVTRRKIIEIIGSMGLDLHEESIPAGDAGSFDAAFISGTSLEVLPIERIRKGLIGTADRTGRTEDIMYDVNNEVLRGIMKRYSEES